MSYNWAHSQSILCEEIFNKPFAFYFIFFESQLLDIGNALMPESEIEIDVEKKEEI